MKQIKQILYTTILLFYIASGALAQLKRTSGHSKQTAPTVSTQLANFQKKAEQANVKFVFPAGFREVKAPDNEDFSFDYAVELPGKDFEIWFQVKSQKENWASYVKSLGNKSTMQANPDSLYLGMGTAHATAFTGDLNYLTRTMPANILKRNNADAGRSYMLNLLDMPVTKHYKYALLITLQKDHTGTILAVCFSNEKGPEFFKNIDRASNCIKFKP